LSPLVVADASVVPAPPVWATSDGGLTAQPPAVVPVVIIVGPPTASEKEAITYEPVIKVVVLMIEVAAMIELAVVEMAFARSKVALWEPLQPLTRPPIWPPSIWPPRQPLAIWPPPQPRP